MCAPVSYTGNIWLSRQLFCPSVWQEKADWASAHATATGLQLLLLFICQAHTGPVEATLFDQL